MQTNREDATLTSRPVEGQDGGAGAAAPPPGTASAPARHRIDLRGFAGRYAVVLALLLMVVVFSGLRPDTFFTTATLKSILVTQAVLVVLALGLTIALAAGEFDLSVASIVGFSAAFLAYLTAIKGWAVGPAVIMSFVAAVVIGVANATFVVVFGVNSFITTLGTGTLITGLATAITGATTIGNVPSAITTPAREQLLGVDLPVIYALVLVVALWYFLEHTPSGRYLFFTGEGRESARLAGVPVDRIRFLALVASAVMAWLAGVLLLGQTGAADPTFGAPFLLPAFAAGFLGATTIKPGRYNAWGTVVAVLLLATGTTGLQLLGAADWVENVFNGGALVIAVTLARLVSREDD